MTPQGTYLPAIRCGELFYISNMDSERASTANFEAPVTPENLDLARHAAARCATNIADMGATLLKQGEHIVGVAKLHCAIVTTECADDMLMLGEVVLETLCTRLSVPFSAALTTYGPASLPGRSGIEAEAVLIIGGQQ
jgi:hypothetical protein